ncbi:TonB-dependent siderophore receptor [Alcanivorax sp. DP30]|uniref:TonB-dependent receptor plug domain-containing protein n=1 Tax=Alcanivorax sp. DP30 TaxID=2606217 RepID=UPI00136F9E0F|nr:TonB-dependent receptor [Alcanivorax sp. DP30]MZR62423.1 TonB-dependent receptor [Alcanivorax sp. DP30]
MQRNLVLAVSLIVSGQVLAGNEIKAVKVSGATGHQLASELPTGTVVIDRQMIDSLPASNLTEVLDTVAGLQVSQLYGINGGGASVDLLGFGATGNQNTLLLLNGRRLSGIDLGTPELSGIPLAAIERIEILPGAGAALYGNGATGGTINIITRQRYQKSAGMEISGGSYNTREGQFYSTGTSGRINGALAYQGLESDGYRDNNDTYNQSLFADLRFQGEGFQAYFTATGEEQTLGLPGGRSVSATENAFREDPQGTDTPLDEVDQDSYWLMPGLRINLSNRTALTLDASRRRQHQEFDYVSGSYASDTVIDSYSLTPKLEGQLTTGSAVHNWTLGFDLNKYDYNSKTSFGNRELEQDQRAWYLHNLISLTPKLSVSAGARKLESTIRGEGEDKEQDGEMYEGGLRYTFTGNLALFAGAQRSVRIANLDELSPFNPPIDPQTGHTYTLGASWSEGMQHSTLTLWRADIDNEILYDPATLTNRNLDDPTLHKGISINSRWRLDEDLTLTANASAQQARFDGGQYSGNDVPLVPEHTMSLSADWQALPWLSAQLSHRYVGDRRYDSDLANEYTKLDHYRSSDLQLTAHYRGAYLRAGVYNLEDNLVADYGVYNASSGGTTLYPLPERHYRIAIGYEL